MSRATRTRARSARKFYKKNDQQETTRSNKLSHSTMSEDKSSAPGLSALPRLKEGCTVAEFMLWQLRFKAYASAKGYRPALKGEVGLPPDDTATSTITGEDELAKRKRNNDAMAALTLAVTSANLPPWLRNEPGPRPSVRRPH